MTGYVYFREDYLLPSGHRTEALVYSRIKPPFTAKPVTLPFTVQQRFATSTGYRGIHPVVTDLRVHTVVTDLVGNFLDENYAV